MELPQFKPAPEIKIMINVGACMDIPNGSYLKGIHNESILNGGVGGTVGIVGIGNNFKSTLMWHMNLTAAARVGSPYNNIYDTEINIRQEHIKVFYNNIPEFNGEDIIETGKLFITDKSIYYGNEWFNIYKKWMQDKFKNAAKYIIKTPFRVKKDNTYFEIIQPTFSCVDSFSEFETEDVGEMVNNNDIGEAGRNTAFMRQGLSKTQFIMELPALLSRSMTCMFLTAQIGKKIAMDPRAPVEKQLQYLKNGDTMKGVTGKFTYLTADLYHCYNAAPLVNQGTKGPEYPKGGNDIVGDTDLNSVLVRNLRSKSGRTGQTIELLVSQSEGVLPTLTEFHYVKSNDRFGISGSLQHYVMDLYPDQKLSRTTVRDKIDNNPRLRQAIHFTSELCQMIKCWPIHVYDKYGPDFFCSPVKLYEDLKQLGYNWDILLDTRSWWCPVGMFEDIPFLSTMDLLRMRLPKDHKDHYHPYWLEDDKTTIKGKV